MIYIMMIFAMTVLTGCNATPDWVADGSHPSSPEWITKDTFMEEKHNVESLYGVGSAQGLKNIPLSWEVSENRARAQVARILQSRMKYAMLENTDVSFKRKTSDAIHQDLTRTVNTSTDILLQGGRVIERYYDDETGTYWSLVKIPAKYLHPEALLNDSDTMSQLETNKSLKEEIEEIF